MRPFTFAPTVRWPTSVCTAYAKSIGVAPAGSVFTSPFGVKTNTSSSKRSVRKLLTHSGEPLLTGLDAARLVREPVGGDPEFGSLLHLARPHLDLQRPPLRADD